MDASSGDGHINVEGRFDGLAIRTGDGSVNARAAAGSKVGRRGQFTPVMGAWIWKYQGI